MTSSDGRTPKLFDTSETPGMNEAKAVPRKVCVVLVDRANYGRLQPVMSAIRQRPELQLQVIAAGTMMKLLLLRCS